MDADKRFAELAGVYWYPKEVIEGTRELQKLLNPYFTDAREVLKVMMDREDYAEWLAWSVNESSLPERCVLANLVIDTTGKLRDLAISFMEERKC
jgi:hypothetical protein